MDEHGHGVKPKDALYFVSLGASLGLMMALAVELLFVLVGLPRELVVLVGAIGTVYFMSWSPFHENGGHH